MASTDDLNQVHRLRAQGAAIKNLAVFDTDPCKCDVCLHTRSIPIDHAQPAVVEGKTVFGLWAKMCLGCFRDVGVGLGLGRGQVLIGMTD